MPFNPLKWKQRLKFSCAQDTQLSCGTNEVSPLSPQSSCAAVFHNCCWNQRPRWPSEDGGHTQGRKPRWMGMRALGSASRCGKEGLVDSTPRLNTHSLPPSTSRPQNRVLPGASLGRRVRWRLLQGRWIVLTPLRPPGYHGTLLLPERKRATWSSQVFAKKLTRWNWPSAFIFHPCPPGDLAGCLE